MELVNIYDKDMDIKYPEGDKLLFGCECGSLLEFSMIEKKTVNDLGKISNISPVSMAKTLDNKLQFVCDYYGYFKELDISTRKQVNSFKVKSAICCVVTCDNKFVITAEDYTNSVLTKWAIRTKKQLHTWQSDVNMCVFSQTCSQDNKYQLIGYSSGWVSIFDLQKHQTLKNLKVMSKCIHSIAFSRDNQSAFICDSNGYLKMIKWQAGANSKYKFDLIQKPQKVCTGYIRSICLTKDEKYLLIGSKGLVSLFEIRTREVTKEFKLTSIVQGICLIKYGKKVIIAERNGNLSIIDLETLEISSIAKNITNREANLRCIIAI